METRGVCALILLFAAPAIEERGRFKLTHQGRDAGSEEYRFEEFDDGQVVLFSKAKYELELAGGLKRAYITDTVLTMDRAFAPLLYAGYRKAGKDEDQVKIEWSKGVAQAGRKQVKTSAAQLFDSTITAHLLPLVRRPEKGRRKLKLFNPNAMADFESYVEDRGEALLKGKDASLKVREFQVGIGYLTYQVHADEKGRILRAWSAGSGMLAELEGFEGWLPEGVAPDGVEELEVEIPGPAGKLSGTLTRPRGAAKVPAVLILSGSGPQDRNGNRVKGKVEEFAASAPDAGLYRELARALSAAGVASLRVDDRGCGKSDGDLSRARLSDLQADAAAALAFLRGRADLGALGLIGHDEGALLGMGLLEKDPAVKALLLLSAPAGTLDEILLARAERQLREQGMKDEALEDLIAGQKRVFAGILASGEDFMEIDERRIFVGWLRDRFKRNPAELLARVKIPLAAFHGGKDRDIPPSHLERLQKLRPDLETRRFEGLDHVFSAGDGQVSEVFLNALAERAAALLQ